MNENIIDLIVDLKEKETLAAVSSLLDAGEDPSCGGLRTAIWNWQRKLSARWHVFAAMSPLTCCVPQPLMK